MSFGLAVLVVISGLLAVRWIFATVAVRASIRIPSESRAEPVPVGDPGSADDFRAYSRRAADALSPHGFQAAAALKIARLTGRTSAEVLLLVNRETKETAAASVVRTRAPGFTRVARQLEFVKRYRDGGTVQTSNASAAGAFASRRDVSATRWPLVGDAGELLRLHRKLVERHGETSPRVLRLDEEFHGDVAAAMAKSLSEEFQAQARAGYLVLTSSASEFRPTWKGSALMAWRLTWPVKAIRRRRHAREARRLLAELS